MRPERPFRPLLPSGMNYTRESANPKSSRDEDAGASLLRREADADLRMRIRNDRSSGIRGRNDEEIYGAR